MKKKIKAVIFDMDGLMFDTEVVAAEMWKQAGKEAGLTITDEFLSHIKGCNWTRSRVWFYKYYDESYDFFAIRTRRMELVNRYLTENGVPVKKGLRELLSYLKERGHLHLRGVRFEILRADGCAEIFRRLCLRRHGDEKQAGSGDFPQGGGDCRGCAGRVRGSGRQLQRD